MTTANFDPNQLYALPPVTIQPIDPRSIMLIRADTGALAAIDARWQPFLNQLRIFRTLPDHARAIAALSPDFNGQEQFILAALMQLLPRQLFISSDAVLKKIETAAPPLFTTPITTVCIRTCDRPAALERLLTALATRTAAESSRYPIEIIDDSRDADHITRNRALAAQFDITYVGRAEQSALLDALCQQFAADADTLRWLLDATNPAHQGQPTYGVLYNLLFLRHAGQHILMLDDDALPSAWVAPNTDWQPLFAEGAGVGWAFLQHATATQQLVAWDGDPLAAHAQTLGLPLATALRQLPGQAVTDPLTTAALSETAFANTVHPYATPGNIRFTVNGLLGDTGSVGDHYLLYQAATAIPDLYTDEAAYQQFRAAPRCAFTGTQRPLLTNVSRLHHTTCAGLALTALIPPVMPTERGEDALLGSLLGYLYPEDFGLRLPFALDHAPFAPRNWQFAPAQLAEPPTANSVLTLWIAAIRAPIEIAPIERLNILAQTIQTLAQRGQLKSRLYDIIQLRFHTVLSEHFALTRQVLATTQTGCNSWRHDVTRINQWLLQRLQQPTALVNTAQLTQLAEMLERYAHALDVWQRAFQFCQQRNQARQ
ncbi:hypothetical protein HUU62_11965 [Rhodoferax sp. 4810]|uniref:Uncharacterized protein n=1 Tax=Thiospirillum jenense TaxID=1653858 RepID=A0A839HCX5_9GAMM|nr:hypothetical protein [Thiospirillum jenense]MBB1075124.1 hypothetical protein [Rhodoferax jenense]MBB1126773.1 hypothetical protein [Thiospirillum jenense]